MSSSAVYLLIFTLFAFLYPYVYFIEYLKTFEISNEDLCLCQVFAVLFVELPPCSSSITMLCCYHVWINLWPATRDKCLASGGSITMYNNVLQCITADITSSLRGDQDTATITTWRPDWLSTGPRFRSRRMGNNINSLLFLLVIITPGFCLLLNCFCFSARNFC